MGERLALGHIAVAVGSPDIPIRVSLPSILQLKS